MAYYVAMDAGGTKAETVLFDETGHILLRDISRGCTAMDIGADETVRRVTQTLHRVGAHIPGGVPDYAFCGVSSVIYYKKKLTDRLDAAMAGWPVHWEDDGPGMISSMLDQRDGGCMVCGTGCSLFLRARGELYHVGGWGYLLDTQGSGYWLGREAILASIKAFEGRGPQTALRELVCAQMGGAPEDNLPLIYDGGRAYIASYAHTVFEARKAGDRTAREIFERGTDSMAELTWLADSHAGAAFDVVMSGGIFAAYPEYVQSVASKGSPRMRLLRSNVPPVLGCAKEAVWRHGGTTDAAFTERFMAEYRVLLEK